MIRWIASAGYHRLFRKLRPFREVGQAEYGNACAKNRRSASFPHGPTSVLHTGDYRTRLTNKRLRETATEFCVAVLILGQVSQTCPLGKDLSPFKRGLPGLDRSVSVYRVAFPPPDRKTVRSRLPSTYAERAFDSLSVRLRQVAITRASSAASRGCGR